ncbi:DUF3099 domain-containing protein [Cellulomonas fimi]|uniref:DUF3099 domain-containing protein n=1 Tax=Cellulomonas fimi TaxID=1708 RepID=A0A7Y0LZH9_CELFI|nr:DUF3099 domain-containing protein [Cellulomonas fimi]
MHRITTAPEPLADDLARRTRRYLVQMGIRVVCFLLAILTWDRVPMWVSAVLLVGAVVLPYVAVILANAGRERRDDPLETIDPRALISRPHDQPPTTGPRA